MENRYINRYNTFCRSLDNLQKSRTANPKDDFVLEGTVQNFNLTFDISWKVMKDILVKIMGISDFAIGSPREVLRTAFTNGIISDDTWVSMLRVRNQLAHDYDGTLATSEFTEIVTSFYNQFERLKKKAGAYFEDMTDENGDTNKS